MNLLTLFASLAFLCSPLVMAVPPDGTVELHAHLFMNEGMTWAFRGDFEGPLHATTWSDRLSSQANPESLEKSGIQILVVALYAHPLFVLSLKDSIRRQIALTESYVRAHPNWVIARNAAEARSAIEAGRRVLILALEGAAGILDSEEDLQEFIDQRGIRIVTLLHLTDDSFGGVALLDGIRGLTSPIAWIKAQVSSNRPEGVLANPSGLTPKGRDWVRKLIDRRVWIDLAHSSDRSQREMIPVLKQRGLPLLYTHTVLRHHLKAERAIADWQLKEVAQSRGIIGLMPSEEMLAGTPAQDGMHALARQYVEATKVLGNSSVVMGSDYNGGIPHIRPSQGTGTTIDQQGLWNIGQVPELWRALKNMGASPPQPLSITIDAFLRAWSKVTDPSNSPRRQSSP